MRLRDCLVATGVATILAGTAMAGEDVPEAPMPGLETGAGDDAGARDGTAVEDGEFFETLDDLPVMPGLAESPEGTVVFDTPHGRLVEVWATGRRTAGEVGAFYAETLPQLGWRRVAADGDGTYRREGEILRLRIHAEGRDGVSIHFALSPDGGPNGGEDGGPVPGRAGGESR